MRRRIGKKEAIIRFGVFLLTRIGAPQRGLVRLHYWLQRKHPAMRGHPYDLEHGVDSGGFLPDYLIPSADAAAARYMRGYMGAQPSSVRWALDRIPSLENLTFIDLGCGKGRAMHVASEYPFRAIYGVELAPSLYADARRNASVFAERYPSRTRIEVSLGDATEFPFPSGDLAVFCYNPFEDEMIVRLVERLESLCKAQLIYFIYLVPTGRAIVDRSPWFTCLCDESAVPVSEDEVGFTPYASYPVVIWRSTISRR